MARKTLQEILSEPASVEEIIRTATAINKLIEDSKKAGVVWPELDVKCNRVNYTECSYWQLSNDGCRNCKYNPTK